MNRNKIKVNELNKLYDEIYYSNLEEIDLTLDLITNLISDTEFQEIFEDVVELPDIISTIIEILDEISELFDNEGLGEAFIFTKEKIDKIQSGEIDDNIENEYIKFIEEEMDDDLLDEDYEEDEEEYEDMDEYDEY